VSSRYDRHEYEDIKGEMYSNYFFRGGKEAGCCVVVLLQCVDERRAP
jgi:hypothetical protein